METIQQQIGALQVIVAKQQVSVKRQRFAIIALAGIIVAGGFIAAVRPVGDATFDTITCKEWNVVDGDGKERITAFTNPDGQASVQWLAVFAVAFVGYVVSQRNPTFGTITCKGWKVVDADGKQRIVAGTHAEEAGVQWLDKHGKKRIAAATLADGQACVAWIDRDEKVRIKAVTLADGEAGVQWSDKDEKVRIAASTLADGKAGVAWLDKDEKVRINAATLADGQAGVAWLDKDEKVRINAATLADGQAGVGWFDKDGKVRINAATLADGQACVTWLDKDGKVRINAATLADGTVFLPTKDLKPPNVDVRWGNQ